MRRRPLRSTPFPYTTLFRSLSRPRGLIGDREGDVDASGTGLGIFAAACGNHHKLATVYFIAGRSCVSGEGKRSEEHTSELQSRSDIVCRLLHDKTKDKRCDA